MWQVPLGEFAELTKRGIAQTGTENYGGPIVTAGGLVFMAATMDAKFRAFDIETGRELWSVDLPGGGKATPMTYRGADGRSREGKRRSRLQLARGRWELRRSTFRQGGEPHRLIVLTDVTKTLREEELAAWQRLIRVLSHEINNSLAPIKSIAGSLERLVSREPKPADWESDMRDGLQVIGGRADSLSRFLSLARNAYSTRA